MEFQIKRVYDQAAPSDGYRVLVDRLWPRGMKKEALKLDLWAKELAPSTELRQWIHSQPHRWAEFEHRYRDELLRTPEAADFLRQLREQERVTLLYATRDEKQNHARILQEFLEEALRDGGD